MRYEAFMGVLRLFNEFVYYSNTCFTINFIEKKCENKPLISLTVTVKSRMKELTLLYVVLKS